MVANGCDPHTKVLEKEMRIRLSEYCLENNFHRLKLGLEFRYRYPGPEWMKEREKSRY